ncbi:MAG: hypothetical protein OIF40_07230, partial [Mangrovicoccus sp.]|nr:hypothetical protein [Mangrovicoccus sp.]
PVMFVVTHRPEFEGLHGLSPLHETIIELARLTKPDAAELIQVVARGQKLPKSLVDQIIERSDGIPLYLEEMTKSLLESNELVARDGRFELADPLATLEIPVTLKDSLMARLDKLSEVKQIAQIGSVLGRRFPRSLLAAVAETSPQSLERALQVLVEDELLFVSGADPDPVYTFKHSMIRDAAYESILNSRRAELHHRVAELLLTRFPDETETLPQVVATHSERAGEVAQAAQYWLKAGHKALAAHAITEALRHLRRGLSMLPHLAPSEQRDRLSFGLHRAMGLAQISAVGWTAKEVEQHFTQALELGEKLGSYRELMTVIFGLWSHWANRAEAGKAAAAIAKAEEIALIDLDGDWHLVLHVMKLVQELWFGSHYEAIREADALLALYDPERHRYLLSMFTQDPRVFAYGFRSWAQWSVGNTEQALADAITSEKIAREMGRPFDLCWQLTLGSLVHYFNRDRDRLADHVQEAMVLAQEQNVDLVKHVVGPAFQGLVHVLGREWQAAQAVFAQALETWKFGGGRVLLPLLEGSLGFVAMRAGNYERGMLALRAGIQSAERNQELWLVPELHRLLARGLAETDPKAAQETLIKARDLAQAQGAFGVLHQIEADLACLLA